MTRQISMTPREELVEALRLRCRYAAFSDRIKIFNEFVALSCYHRKHANLSRSCRKLIGHMRLRSLLWEGQGWCMAVTTLQRLRIDRPRNHFYSRRAFVTSEGAVVPSESLSFTLRPVETYADLLLACAVRAEAYGHKVPAYRESMAKPDAVDASPWTAIFLCEDKATGNAVGTMRVQSTTRGGTKLEIEKYVTPPPELELHGRAEITRLSSIIGADPFVRLALWKAAYLYCMATQSRWLNMGVPSRRLGAAGRSKARSTD